MSRKRSPAKRSLRKLGTQFNQYTLDQLAETEGPRRKNWHFHDLKHITALTSAQGFLMSDFAAGDNVIADGCPGTGKSYLACYLALNELLTNPQTYDKIIIVRSAVPTRESGFLPGTLEEKMAIYETPYIDIFSDLLRRPSSYADMKLAGKVEFHSTSYLRSLTWDNAIVIFDEAQNGTFHEINSVLTRIGENSRLIICGDSPQTDLNATGKNAQKSGFETLLMVAEKIPGFSTTTFGAEDIVRSGFVKQWIQACIQSSLL